MSFTAILGVISGVFKFWDQVMLLVKILQGTPEEHHEAIMAAIALEAEKFKQTGRPEWN